MAGQPEHQFDIQFAPAWRTSKVQSSEGHTVFKVVMLEDYCQVHGWFLPKLHGSVHGIRAISGSAKLVARRKQLRPDIYFHHHDHPESSKSGFKIQIPVKTGYTIWQFEYKNAVGQWELFCIVKLALPPMWRFLRKWVSRIAASEYEKWAKKKQAAEASTITLRLEKLKNASRQPLISILLPVYNTPEKWLRRAIKSVCEQSYPHWELCIADDCSTEPHIADVLNEVSRHDARIKVTRLSQNGHISRSSNEALNLCTGEFTALLDHDDEIASHALLRIAEEIILYPDANLIFSDEDKISEKGVRSDPAFKPGANLELLLSCNFICHFTILRTSLLKEIGGFRVGFEGAQDWDLFLRFTSVIPRESIRHVPEVLYHWRTLESSTASKSEAKPYARTAGFRAVESYLQKHYPDASIIGSESGKHRIVWPLPSPAPKVSIIIPTRDRLDLLQVAVESLFTRTTYASYELIIIDHASAEPATLSYLQALETSNKASVIRAEGEFNWSRLNNMGAKNSTGDILLFLNNDIEITHSDWLDELVRNVCRESIGAVGARLHYPNGSIQHAGVALRLLGMAGHLFQGLESSAWTLAGTASDPREVTAVTGACLAVKRAVFEKAGGFDEEKLPVSYNDVDFCLRLRSQGYRNLYAAHAILTHHESASRYTLEKESARKAAATAEAQIMLARWPEEFAADAFYNPNLSLLTTLPSLPNTSEI